MRRDGYEQPDKAEQEGETVQDDEDQVTESLHGAHPVVGLGQDSQRSIEAATEPPASTPSNNDSRVREMTHNPYNYAYCIVAANDGRVIAVQGDDGNLSMLADTIAEIGSPTSGYYVTREPVERARGLLFEVHPDHESR